MIRSVSSALSCAILSAVAFAGCGSGDAGDPRNAENTGTVNLALVSQGVTLNSVTYTITGTGFTKIGIVDITNAPDVALLIGGIPVGTFAIKLSAVDANDATDTCSGAASFDITAQHTTSTLINMYCKTPSKTGSVSIYGTVQRCPTLASVSAEPSDAFVGDTIKLVAYTDYPPPNQYSSLYVYRWTANGGKLTNSNASTATLTCTKRGPVQVTVVVSTGDGACSDGTVLTVGCASVTPPAPDNPNTPGDDSAGMTACGNGSCGPGSGCCTNGIGCAGGIDVCPYNFQACDGPEDCDNPGERCFNESYAAKCELNTTYSFVRCHTNADCVTGTTYPNPCSATGECLAFPNGQP